MKTLQTILIAALALTLVPACEHNPEDYASTEANPARESENELREPSARLVVHTSTETYSLMERLTERYESQAEGSRFIVEKGDFDEGMKALGTGKGTVVVAVGEVGDTGLDNPVIKPFASTTAGETLSLVANEEPAGDVQTRFIEFALSKRGQELVEDEGYVAVAEVAEKTVGDIRGEY